MAAVSARYFCRISTTTVDMLSQKSPTSNYTEICPKGATMIRRTDGQTELSKLEWSLSATRRTYLNIKTDREAGIGLIWLRIGTSGGLL